MPQQLTNNICRGYGLEPSLLELFHALVLEQSQSTDVRLSRKYRFFPPFLLKMLTEAF